MAAPSSDVLVVGDLMVDVVVRHDGPIATGSDTASTVRTLGGGSAANTAAWLGDAGVPVRLLAAIGDDAAGRSAVADLVGHGVEVVGPVVTDAVTGTCVVLVGDDGERTMFPDRGANAALRPADVDDAFTVAPAAVHVSGYTVLGPDSRAAGRAAIAAGRRAGLPVSVDASSAAPIRAVGADAFLGWIHGVDLLFANDDEVEALGGEARILASVGALVAKHGAAGAGWTDGRDRVAVDAAPAELLDSTGAGDAFAAGYLVEHLADRSPDEALRAGAARAARAVGSPGARPTRPRT